LTEKRKGGRIPEVMKLPRVDKEICIGCGTCTVLAPGTFKLGADGKAEVINPPGDPEEKIQDAVDSCPVKAITLKN
jgi:ferredoxin